MKTVLVLAQHPELAHQIQAALSPEQYRVVHHMGVEDAEPLLAHGPLSVCVVDVESSNVQGLWLVEKLRRLVPKCPILVYTGASPWEWEEEAYLQGVAHVLRKPARSRLLGTVLERLWSQPARSAPSPPPRPPRPETEKVAASHPEGIQTASESLRILRDLSTVLTHSLCAEEMLKQFMLRLREIIGVNRAAIFLRQPAVGTGRKAAGGDRQLRLACAIGLSSDLLQHFELSFETGIGGHLYRLGRILRRDNPEALADSEVQKEFELLGGQVAIPILDRETLVGIAVFDGRVTGEPLGNTELELLFHLLEQLGLAIKNIWLHDQLSANHGVLSDILRELNSGCIVVSRELAILHANKAAGKLFAKGSRSGSDPEFADLPQSLGSKIYQVLKTGMAVGGFKYELEHAPGSVFSVTIIPLHSQNSVLPTSALLTAEDLTQAEKLKRLEIEAASLRLLKSMSERSAHDIGNVLVPLSTHQQLLKQKWKDPDFITSLDESLSEGVRRIARRVDQMRYLANDELETRGKVALDPVIEEVFREAQKHVSAEFAQLKYKKGRSMTISGDRAALRRALFEIILNALQANPADPRIEIRLEDKPGAGGRAGLEIEVEDTGVGFSPEELEKAGTAFWTRRTVGMGLGLAVARKIVEMHHGKLNIRPVETGHGGVVALWFPAESSEPAKSQPAAATASLVSEKA
jgi:signal transduction histidine kinase/CheY-like chemotaxis protein